jgi:hypothetical protein
MRFKIQAFDEASKLQPSKRGRHEISFSPIRLPNLLRIQISTILTESPRPARHFSLSLGRRERSNITPAKPNTAPITTSENLPVPCPLGKNPPGDAALSSRIAELTKRSKAKSFLYFISNLAELVEARGFEPLTPALQTRCSAN